MAVTVVDVARIKAGTTKSFVCDTPKEAKSGQSTVSYVKKFCRNIMPSDVRDYKTSIDGNVLHIEALSFD